MKARALPPKDMAGHGHSGTGCWRDERASWLVRQHRHFIGNHGSLV